MQHNPNPLSLRERNRQRIYERIVTSAFDLFNSSGYAQTTMDTIAQHAGISRGTLFNYFPSKDALLMPYAKQLYAKRIQHEILTYLRTQPTTIEALRFLLMNIHDQILSIPGMHLALRHEFHQPINPDMTQDSIGFFENIMSILQHGQQRDEIRTDIPLPKLAHYIGVLFVSLFFSIAETNAPSNYSTEVETLLTFISSSL